MKQRWTFRCYPTLDQEAALLRVFGCTRYVYNWALEARTKAFQRGERMNYNQSSAALTKLKRQPETVWLNEVSCVPLQQALRHLQTAFRNFFNKSAGYPSFKKKGGKQSAEYTRSALKFEIGNQRLILSGIGRLKVRWSKHVPVYPTTATVIRKPSGRYFVSLVVDVLPVALPKTGKSVGIDFGINRLATLSTGERIANPKYLNRYRHQIARIQKDLARKKKGSGRYERCRIRLAKLHEKIADSRKDTINKLAWNIVTKFDTIYIEDLNLRSMVKNHNLARSLSDAAIGSAAQAIEAKANMHGKAVVKIDRFFPSSKLCSSCGALHSKMRLSIREWCCQVCGAAHDRDENAAHNILAVGQTVTARGDGIRLLGTSVPSSNCL